MKLYSESELRLEKETVEELQACILDPVIQDAVGANGQVWHVLSSIRKWTWGRDEWRDLSNSGWPGVHSDTFSLGFLKPGFCHEFTRLHFKQFQLFFQAVGTHQSLGIRPWLLLGWFPFSLLFLNDLVELWT